MDAPKPSRRRAPLPTAVVLLGVTSFFTDVASDMVFPLLPVFMAGTLHAGATYLGAVEGAADTVSSLVKLASGYLADRVPKKKPLVLLGYGIASIVRPLLGLATLPWHVLAVRVLDRIGKGTRAAPRDVLIATSAAPGQTGRAFGFHRAMDHAGAVVGPLLATLLLSLGVPMRTVFVAAAVPGALAMLALMAVREPVAATPKTESAAATVDAANAGVALPPRLKRYLLIVLLFSLGNSSDVFLLLRAQELGVSIAALPAAWALLHIVKVGSSFFAGDLSDRVPRARLIVGGWLVFAATYVGLAWANATWQAWTCFSIYGIYHGLCEPAEKALVKDLAPDAVRGKAFGHYNFVVGIGALPASLLTGWIWRQWGGAVALGVGAVIALLAAAMLSRWRITGRSSAL